MSPGELKIELCCAGKWAVIDLKGLEYPLCNLEQALKITRGNTIENNESNGLSQGCKVTPALKISQGAEPEDARYVVLQNPMNDMRLVSTQEAQSIPVCYCLPSPLYHQGPSPADRDASHVFTFTWHKDETDGLSQWTNMQHLSASQLIWSDLLL